MKYKLINKTTGEEHICEKVTIDEFDYYVNDETFGNYHWYINTFLNKLYHSSTLKPNEDSKRVISTNNPSVGISKVVDEVDVLGKTMVNSYLEKIKDLTKRFFWKAGFKCGYNKSQETHPYSDDDMVEFGNWLSKEYNISDGIGWWHSHESIEDISTKELLQLWKEQKTKILYYE